MSKDTRVNNAPTLPPPAPGAQEEHPVAFAAGMFQSLGHRLAEWAADLQTTSEERELLLTASGFAKMAATRLVRVERSRIRRGASGPFEAELLASLEAEIAK